MSAAVLAAALAATAPVDAHPLDARRFALVPGETSKVTYYELRDSPEGPFVHADYRRGLDTMKRGIPLTDVERQRYHRLRWRWRVLVFPTGGDECSSDDKQDSGASLYLGWRSGLRWYSLKYVWTQGSPQGTVCRKMRNPFVVSDTVVLESGGPTGVWATETLDLDREFRAHFTGGDAHAEIPRFIGFMILTDGDQTHSPASADYGNFELLGDPVEVEPGPNTNKADK